MSLILVNYQFNTNPDNIVETVRQYICILVDECFLVITQVNAVFKK